MSTTIPVSAIVVTRNEEANIARCLGGLSGFVDEIFVVDSESEDRTREIASGFPVQVHTLPYDHSKIIPWIYQWALDTLPLRNEWVMILEADQLCSDELKDELRRLFLRGSVEQDGFFFRRKQVFRGKWIRFGGYGSKYLLKLFRKGKGSFDVQEEEPRVYVQGKTASLKGWLVEDNAKEHEILFYLQKHLRYAQAIAKEELLRRSEGFRYKYRPSFFGSPDHRTLWLKQMYYRLPLYVRPWLYFFHRYFLLLGFLDGKEGFIFHFLQAFWYRLVVDIRIEEMMRQQKARKP
jgi:glycosyltransferase involved in cell wall biosynthesis